MDEILSCLIEEVNRCRGLAKIPGIETFKDEYLHKAELLERAAEIVKQVAAIGPHGRLIEEADAEKEVERFLGYLDEDMIYRIKFAIRANAPTIIPASEEATK